MKNIITIVALGIILQFSACSEDEKVAPRTGTIDKLAETPWGDARVTHADGDLSAQYQYFAIAFTKQSSGAFDGQFVISNGGHAFPETSGRWRFNAELTQIIFDSGTTIDYQLNETSLTLDFTTPPPSGGRVKGLGGHFIFELKRL
jgi:hypothetical protein